MFPQRLEHWTDVLSQQTDEVGSGWSEGRVQSRLGFYPAHEFCDRCANAQRPHLYRPPSVWHLMTGSANKESGTEELIEKCEGIGGKP